MSNPNEEEKLTPSSGKGYDGDSTFMADNSEFDENLNKQKKPSEQGEVKGDEEEVKKQEENESKRVSVASLFMKMLVSADPEDESAEGKIFKTVVKSVLEADAKNKTSARIIAEAFSPFIINRKGEERADSEKAVAVFEIVIDTAKKAGLDPKDIAKELDTIAREKQQEEAPIEDARFEPFEDHVKEILNKSSEDNEALEAMHEDLKKLRAEIANDTKLDEGLYDVVLTSETLLAELAEVKDDAASQELNLREQEYDRKFAQVIVTVFESASETSFGKVSEDQALKQAEEESYKADHLIRLLLAGNDPITKKAELIAALIESNPIRGTDKEKHDALALRTRIKNYAKLAGIDDDAIAEAQVVIAAEELMLPKNEAVNELESVPMLDVFERKVEEQIMNASVDRVREIQDTWRDLLKQVDPASETARLAQEAINVLGNIIQLRNMQAARDRGEKVDFSTLPLPGSSPDDGNQENGRGEDRDGKNKELAELLAKLFNPLRRGDKLEDYALVSIVTDAILASAQTKAKKEALLADIAACFPQSSMRPEKPGDMGLHGYLMMYADSEHLAHPPIVIENESDTDGSNNKERKQKSTEALQKLIQQALPKISGKDMQKLKAYLGHIAVNEHPSAEVREQIDEAITVINGLPIIVSTRKNGETLPHAASQRPVEQPANANKTEQKKVGEEIEIRPEAFEVEEQLTDEQSQTPDAVKQSFLEETRIVTEEGNLEKFEVERLEQYVSALKKLFEGGALLSEDELKAAYAALQKQVTLVRKAAELKGKDVSHITEMQNETMPLLADRLLMHISPSEFMEFRKKMNREFKENKTYRERVAFDPRRVVTNYTPINVAPTPYSHGGAIGNTINEIRNLSAPTGSAFTRLTPDLQREVPNIIQGVKKQDVITSVEQVHSMEAQLSALISDGLRAGKTLQELTEARALALKLGQQKEALQAMDGYKSTKEKKNYKEEDAILYEGYVHTALGERMHRIQVELEIRNGAPATYTDADGNIKNHKRIKDEDILSYYTELRKWVKILLNNDFRNNPDKPDAVRLSPHRFKKFTEIFEKKDIDLSRDAHELLNNVKYMFDGDANTGGNFLRYFLRNTPNPKGARINPDVNRPYAIDRNNPNADLSNPGAQPDPYNPDNLLGVDYLHSEGTSSFGLPKSLEDSMAIIASQYNTTDYKTGGDHELIDAEGNFKYNNFYYWIREQINFDVSYNKDGQINPMSKINLKGDASSVSLAELLILVPEYLSKRNFEININDKGEVDAAWGRQVEHPEFTWTQAQQLGAEVEFRMMIHETRIQYIQAGLSGDKGKFLQLMEALHKNNHWSRGGEDGPNVLWLLGLPSSVTSGTQEIDETYGTKEKQGSVGKAISDMLVGYYYLSEVSDFHTVKEKGSKREKTFNENMFYKFWEANGANTFLINVAEGALGTHNEARISYAEFIKKRINAAAQVYRSSGLSADQQEKLNVNLKRQLDSLDNIISVNNRKMTVSFTESEHLSAFYKTLQKDGIYTGLPDISKQVRNDLIDNLKGEYFTALKDMEIYDVGGPDSTGLTLLAKGKKKFKDIDFEGTSMGDILDSFDPDQIRIFDYQNGDANDPIVMAGARTEAEMRRALDAFMDPSRNSRNHELFKKNERLMLAFTKHITRFERKWLNHMRDIPENEQSRNLIQAAFRKCVEKAYRIDTMESEYSWTQARDYGYIWGIGGMLDVSGIGFRWDGKLFHTGRWRHARGGKDGAGNEGTFAEFGALSLPFLHMMRILDLEGNNPEGHQSVWSLLQGGHGGYIKPRAIREFKARSQYRMAHDAEELYVANNLSNSCELADLLSSHEFDFSHVIRVDTLGNVVFEYDKARDLFKKWRKAIRYTYQKNGLDYREKIWVDGREKTLYDHFLGKKTRAINELIARETKRSDGKKYTQLADAVMCSIIAAEVYEHRKSFTNAPHWSIENVMQLEVAIRQFMNEVKQEEDDDGDPVTHHDTNAFTEKVFRGSLKAYNTAYYKMYAVELGSTFGGGILAGLWAAMKESFKGPWVR